MTEIEMYLEEFLEEAAKTKLIIEAIPASQSFWKPTEKSMSLIHMAAHLVELTWWMEIILTTDFIDYLKVSDGINKYRDKEKILSKLSEVRETGSLALKKFNEKNFENNWSLRFGDDIIFSISKRKAIREHVFNHMIHHRGQLTMFLRLMDIKVPGIFGPTADEMPAHD